MQNFGVSRFFLRNAFCVNYADPDFLVQDGFRWWKCVRYKQLRAIHRIEFVGLAAKIALNGKVTLLGERLVYLGLPQHFQHVADFFPRAAAVKVWLQGIKNPDRFFPEQPSHQRANVSA